MQKKAENNALPFMLTILPLDTDSAISLWNDFTASCPVPSPFSFNPSLYYFYQNHFDWEPCYVFLFRKNELFGLFPLVNTGRAWVSLPHFSYGGLLMKKYAKEIDWEQLVLNVVFSLNVGNVISGFFQVNIDDLKPIPRLKAKFYLRSSNPILKKPGYNKVSSVLFLPSRSEELLDKLSSNLRRKICKAEKTGLSVSCGGAELLNDFYPVYVKNMHRLGSPVYGKQFFKDLLGDYQFGEIYLFVIYNKKKPVASSVLMSYNDFWENTWFSTRKEEQKRYVSDFLHWQMIKYAIKQNAAIYSFGRSDEKGNVFRYKNHWPVKNIPLYEYSLNRRVNLKNHKWLAGLWRNVPLPVAWFLGPLLVKHIY